MVSPDGLIPGCIFPDATSYKIPGFTRLQKLLTVHLEGFLRRGDSGSAVVDADTGVWYGQIILGSPGNSLAYCVRSPDILADITGKIGQILMLDETHWEVNKTLYQIEGAYMAHAELLNTSQSLRELRSNVQVTRRPFSANPVSIDLTKQAESPDDKILFEDLFTAAAMNPSLRPLLEDQASGLVNKTPYSTGKVQTRPDAVRKSNNTEGAHRRKGSMEPKKIRRYKQKLGWCQANYGAQHEETLRQRCKVALAYEANGEHVGVEKPYLEAINTMMSI